MNGFTREAFKCADHETRGELLYGAILDIVETVKTHQCGVCVERKVSCGKQFKGIYKAIIGVGLISVVAFLICIGVIDWQALERTIGAFM